MSHAKQTGEDGQAVEKLGRKRLREGARPAAGRAGSASGVGRARGIKVCIVFEGRDTAGKGGVIKPITERVSPRVFRVVALPAPTEREKSQMYVQRYLPHFPAAGEVVIFDRSWYNRAGVERVMGFCSEDDAIDSCGRAAGRAGDRRLRHHPAQVLARGRPGGTDAEDRVAHRRPRKVWKLSPMDLKSYSRWYDYSRARDDMFAATDTDFAPWHVADSNDKKRARLNIISHLLEQIPYDSRPEPFALPARRSETATASPTTPTSYIPAKY